MSRACLWWYGAALVAATALPPRTAAAQTRVVIVSGLGGAPKYSAEFDSLGESLGDALTTRFGVPDADVVWLGEHSESKRRHYGGQSTKVNVERALAQVAKDAGAGDQIVVVLIGHGSGDGEQSKISIPGPDLTARDFARALDGFGGRKLAFVDLTSASGDMLPILSGPNRVIITATKSSFERNESHFGRYFVDALAKDVSDVNKDGRVSLLEAFQYAVVETKRVYDNASKLQTEHAQFDDRGMKTGVADPDGRTGQGLLARRFFLDATFASAAGANDPRLAALYKDKFALEDEIDQLRVKKASMQPDAYDDALENLLVQLARKARSIRQIEGRKS